MEKSIDREIVKLKETIEENQKELNIILSLLEKFPDLEIAKSRWGRKMYFSKSVNNIVDQYYDSFSCGCCDDAPLFIHPYIEVDGIKIHSKPAKFCIGEKSNYNENGVRYNIFPWEELEKHNISSVVINQIQKLVFDEEPDLYDDLEE